MSAKFKWHKHEHTLYIAHTYLRDAHIAHVCTYLTGDTRWITAGTQILDHDYVMIIITTMHNTVSKHTKTDTNTFNAVTTDDKKIS